MPVEAVESGQENGEGHCEPLAKKKKFWKVSKLAFIIWLVSH
jgi:hypothetical protein